MNKQLPLHATTNMLKQILMENITRKIETSTSKGFSKMNVTAVLQKNLSPKTFYVCDFLNIFSDFREIKYKKQNIDFHCVKHNNKEQDTIDFFDLFFSKYISYVGISKNSSFLFVMKKLNDYEPILESIITKHKSFDIKLLIIEDKYKDSTLDKNKDDFLCQYIFDSIQKSYGNCILVSNDRYRDRDSYVNLFVSDISIKMLKWNPLCNMVQSSIVKFAVNNNIRKGIVNQTYKRCTIPKHRLTKIL